MGFIIPDIVLGIAGILFWFSDGFAHSLGVVGFFSRFFSGFVCFVLVTIITFIVTR